MYQIDLPLVGAWLIRAQFNHEYIDGKITLTSSLMAQRLVQVPLII